MRYFPFILELVVLLSTPEWGLSAGEPEAIVSLAERFSEGEAPILPVAAAAASAAENHTPTELPLDALLLENNGYASSSTEDSLQGSRREVKRFLLRHKTMTVFLVLGILLLSWCYVLGKEEELVSQ